MEEISDDLKCCIESSDEEFEGIQGVNFKNFFIINLLNYDFGIFIQNWFYHVFQFDIFKHYY